MTTGKGFEGILGVVKEGSWGSPLAVTKAIPFVSESLSRTIEKHIDDVLRGKAGRGPSVAGNRTFFLTIPCKLTYEGLDLLIAITMGAAGVPVMNGALYNNTYSLAENLDYSVTAAIYKGVSVWEYAGGKIQTMKISGSANKPLDIEFGVAFKDLDLASAINTAGILQALDTEDAAPKIMFSDLEFKIAAQATALASGTEKGIESFELTMDNGMIINQFDNRAKTILEPQRDGYRKVDLNFNLGRYEDNVYQDWHNDDEALHAWLKFVNGNYLFDMHFPQLTIDNPDAPVDGPGLIKQKVPCVAYRDPASASASFTETDEMEIAVTNGISTNPLA